MKKFIVVEETLTNGVGETETKYFIQKRFLRYFWRRAKTRSHRFRWNISYQKISFKDLEDCKEHLKEFFLEDVDLKYKGHRLVKCYDRQTQKPVYVDLDDNASRDDDYKCYESVSALDVLKAGIDRTTYNKQQTVVSKTEQKIIS